MATIRTADDRPTNRKPESPVALAVKVREILDGR
jgi:hypothetical protein